MQIKDPFSLCSRYLATQLALGVHLELPATNNQDADQSPSSTQLGGPEATVVRRMLTIPIIHGRVIEVTVPPGNHTLTAHCPGVNAAC